MKEQGNNLHSNNVYMLPFHLSASFGRSAFAAAHLFPAARNDVYRQ